MNSSHIKSCPRCGGERIGIHRKVLTHFEVGDDKVQVWAFCRNCGHRSLSAFGRFSVDEGTDAAIRLWNQEG